MTATHNPDFLNVATVQQESPAYKLVYQPIFKIGNAPAAAVAFESLLRVQRNGRMHGPLETVAAAEADGSIVAIDQWVLREVIRLALTRPRLRVWVNASQISIGNPLFLDDAIQVLKHSNTLGRISFEVTETADVDARILAKRLEVLKVHALTVIVDDLRDGHAKRELLHSDAVSGCKLSRETTIELQASEKARVEVQAIVALCRQLGKKVVLEGIENEGDLSLARDLGIEYCQGYHFGYPSEPEKLLEFSAMNPHKD